MTVGNQVIEQKILKYARTLAPRFDSLPLVLSGQTGKTSAGFPYISEECFRLFQTGVPHLFADGAVLLDWLSHLRAGLDEEGFTAAEFQDVQASIRVIETVIQTAAVTCVPDCWTLKWVLSVWKTAGALDLITSAGADPESLRRQVSADARLFQNDLSLLICRGIVTLDSSGRIIPAGSDGGRIIGGIQPVPPTLPADVTSAFADLFSSAMPAQSSRILVQQTMVNLPAASERHGWQPTLFDIEAGFRLMPLVLALRLNQQCEKLRVGRVFGDVVRDVPAAVRQLLQTCGYIGDDDRVTRLGDRVFARGPGPFGIIHAYHPYMAKLSELIKGTAANVWVERGKNVAASQDANRKTFELANESLDLFCRQTGFSYSVFIEHAVGQGEATRQRFRKPGGDSLQFFGADLEDAAINAAVEQQRAGVLPQNMQFIRNADIGKPELVTDAVSAAGFATAGAVMMVGNGFHEVRQQSNDRMVEVFRGYCAAGLVLIFTEESGLSDEDLLATGWNTYHAGFRYVHELSGQGLRPAHDRDDAPAGRYSWGKCAALAGYRLLKNFTTRTRTIFPHPRPDGYNPAISVNYFCVPAAMADQLGLKTDDWQKFPGT
jgi:hypothetical protein